MKVKQKSSFKLSKNFYRTFFLLFILILALFLAFVFYTQYSSMNALEHELLSYSHIQIKSIGDTIDSHMLDMRYIMATLSTQESATSFYHFSDPNIIYENNNSIVCEQLLSYQYSFSYLDSIYLYSPASNTILSSLGASTPEYADDSEWLTFIDDAADKSYLLFPRKKYGHYPYLMSFLKAYQTGNGYAGIIVNVDLSKMDPLPSYTGKMNELVYIISDEGKIIYEYNQREYMEPYDTVAHLASFSAQEGVVQHFIHGEQPYIYSQYHSADYPWSYVLITSTTGYEASLAASQNYLQITLAFIFVIAVFLIFIIVFRASRPINAIVRLLNNPIDFTYQDVGNKESQEIVQKVLAYIQTNSLLSAELEKQVSQLQESKMLALQSQINPHFMMNTLNLIRMSEIQALGFDHDVPNMTLMLSRLLQYALSAEDHVPLGTEMHYAKQFVQLMSRRYKNSILFSLKTDPAAENVVVPKLIIQPLVENAVFHGLSAVSDRQCQLNISVTMEDSLCVLIVKDNGLGMSAEKLSVLLSEISNYDNTPSTSIGLHNVILRMHLLYGSSFSYCIESIEGAGTTVTLRFPKSIS